jgi:hypothetical protein
MLMDIYTTLNILLHRKVYYENILLHSDISLQELIKICLKKLAPILREDGFQNGPIKYQPMTLSYKPLPFSMSNNEYDIYMDLKKISKFSLSYLVAMALDRFAETVLQEKELDSYQNTDYFYLLITYKSRPGLVFCWDEIIKKEEKTQIMLE